MENFVIIKRILVYLMKAMDLEEVDLDEISAEDLGISEVKRASILHMMKGAGLIDGVDVMRTSDGDVFMEVNNPAITLRGLEYLYDSKFMFEPEEMAAALGEDE